MNKKWTRLSLALALCGTNAFAGDMGYIQPADWTGFYVGANAGYAWSANNNLQNISRVTYADPLFPLAQIRAASLAFVTTNRMFTSANSFMGGAQIGYNSQFSDKLVIGIETDLDALRFNSSAARSDTAPSVFGTYTSNATMTKKLDYLGLLKGRLGYLISQSFLVYGSGAFAYGGASLATTYSVTNSQTNNLSPIYSETSKSRILGGWSAGAGAEWMFTPCWSMKLEYLYYDLGTMHTYLNLGQTLVTTPTTLYAGAIVESQAKYTGNAVRLGLNYRFA